MSLSKPIITGIYSDGIHAHVSSHHRLSGSSTNFSFSFEVPKVLPGREWNKVCVVDAVIPKSWYLVISGKNTFILREDATDIMITVPPGNYSRKQWTSQIPTIMTARSLAEGHGWTYTALPSTEPDNGTLIYSVTGNGLSQPTIVVGNYMNQQIGFTTGEYTFVGGHLNTVLFYSEQTDSAVHIRSNICATDGNDDCIADVCDVGQYPPGSLIKFQAQHPTLQSRRFVHTMNSQYTMQLVSAITEEPLDLNGQDIYVHLKIYHEDLDITELRSIKEELELLRSDMKAKLPVPSDTKTEDVSSEPEELDYKEPDISVEEPPSPARTDVDVTPPPGS